MISVQNTYDCRAKNKVSNTESVNEIRISSDSTKLTLKRNVGGCVETNKSVVTKLLKIVIDWSPT